MRHHRQQSELGSAAARQRERNDALEGRIEEVEEKLRSGLEEVRAAVAGEVKALREEQAKERLHVERRLLRLEAGMNGFEMSSQASVELEPTKRRYVRPKQAISPTGDPGSRTRRGSGVRGTPGP